MFKLCEAAGFDCGGDKEIYSPDDNSYVALTDELTKLIALAKAAAYEDAAKLLERKILGTMQPARDAALFDAINAIRNRANEVTK